MEVYHKAPSLILYSLDQLNLTCYTKGMKITPEQFNKLATKDDVREIVEEKVSKFKDEILTGQDNIIGELKTIREEQAAFN